MVKCSTYLLVGSVAVLMKLEGHVCPPQDTDNISRKQKTDEPYCMITEKHSSSKGPLRANLRCPR